LIESTAIGPIVTAAALWPYPLGILLIVGRLQALEHDIVVIDQLPDRAQIATGLIGYDRLSHIAIRVGRVGHIKAKIVFGDIFRPLQKSIVISPKEIVALVPRYLADGAG
jgi:hypothetical protein